MENKENIRACLVAVFKNCFLFLKTKNTENVFGKGGDFCFCVRERPLFREQKKVVSVVFFTFQGRVVLRVFFSCFLCFPTCGFSFSSKKWRSWRMKMVAMLVDYGGLGMSEWLWVWKVSAIVRCFEGQGHRWRCHERWCVVVGWKAMVAGFKISVESYPPRHWLGQVRCQVRQVRLWDSQIPIWNHQFCSPLRLKKKKKNYFRLTQPLPHSKSIKMRDQGMRAPLPHYNWRTVGASMLVDGDSSSSTPGLNLRFFLQFQRPSTMIDINCDWDLGESFGFGDLLVVVGIWRTIFGKLVIL